MSRLFLQIAQVLRFLQKTVGQFVHSRKHNWLSRLKYSISRFIFSASADMSCHNQNFQSKQYINIVSFSILRQHRAIVSASRSRLFPPLLQFEKREILRSRCQRKLAYGCGIPLAGTYSIPLFSKL